MNATPVKDVAGFGLLIVKVKVETPPSAIGSGEKFLPITGGLSTVRVSLAVLPVPALVELTASLVLLYAPLFAAVTTTVTVQLLLAGSVPPLRATVLPPATAVTVPPAQVVAAFGGVAFTSPPG